MTSIGKIKLLGWILLACIVSIAFSSCTPEYVKQEHKDYTLSSADSLDLYKAAVTERFL
jgi:hypothetical protein